ncbi:hypothetical protein J2Y00_003586 [Deinococcus soli (ex Cha et al. 2016)]|uniref:Uncharacterized protein n=1 Tax=Deinococcus soli (ex Cha et al. 2016) TaxID=1309411 RepID=A0AAE3XDK3_9DEIO|nr:hypothetical protein [Deinococcus soli (ex Cha et al. 2016)]MDR6219975.1 hypothetical protein [Deinococcus soli (ex Cha et al. 2016)]
MTLFTLLTFTGLNKQIEMIYGCVFIFAAIFRNVLDKELFWFVVLLLVLIPSIIDWWSLGGHAFLILYWILAIFLSFFSKDRLCFVGKAGQYLISCTFLFAAIWKFISPEFANGDVMKYFMITTIPMGITTSPFTGLDRHSLLSNINNISQLLTQDTTQTVNLVGKFSVDRPAAILTTITQFIEVAIASSFILPVNNNWSIIREILLILFFLTAYVVMPVPGFAVLFSCIGFTFSKSVYSKAFFLVAFFVWQIITLPFLG